jgi:hypothetical protein
MKSTFTGIRDIDVEILNRLDDRDLISFCSTDKYAKSICDLETFWQRRTLQTFRKYLSLETILNFKNNKLWIQYYIEIVKILNSENLENEAAKALENKRYDIVELLKRLKHIQVEFVQNVTDDDTYESYYLSRKEGDLFPKKQGKYIYETYNETEEGQYLNGVKVGKWFSSDRAGLYSIDEYHNNGKIKSHELWHGNNILEREYYDENSNPIFRTLWIKNYF